MDNYPYIIAGLPELLLNYKAGEFDFDSLVEEVSGLCSQKDRQLIRWLVFGLTPENLSDLFYNRIAKSGSRFLREYFAFDKTVREEKVVFLEGSAAAETESEDVLKVRQIFAEPNLIEREKHLDALMWQKASDIVTGDLFSIDVILSFLAKAGTVARWSRLDPRAGGEMFKSLIQEVRGTFKYNK